MVFAPDLELELRSSAGALVTDLPLARDITWSDVMSDVGDGSFTLPGDDPNGPSLVVGLEIWCFYRGTFAQHLLLQRPAGRSKHSAGEEAEQVWSISAPSVADELKWAKVTPFYDWDWTVEPPLPFVPKHRAYTFATPQYTIVDTGNPASWHQAVEGVGATELDTIRHVMIDYITIVDGVEYVESLPAPAPLEWVVPEAKWIWPQADTFVPGYAFFATTFTVTEEQTLTFDVTADNQYKMFIDGHAVLGNDETRGWQNFERYEEVFQPGTYTLRFVARNDPWAIPEANPAGLLYAVYAADNDGNVLDLIAWSSSATLSLGYPAEWPGMTAGQIISDLFYEAQQRGLLLGWTLDFSSTTDSDGDSFPPIPEFSVPVGSSLLDVLRDLVKQGWIDFRALPGRTLQVWNASSGYDSGISITVTGDVDTQQVESSDFEPISDVPLSALIINYDTGTTRIDDAAAAAAWGDREEWVTVNASTEAEAIRQGNDILAKNNQPHWSNVVGMRPTSDADAPYLGFQLGWQVDAPDILDGADVERRVVNIQMAQDENGAAEPILDLEKRVEPLEQPFNDLIEALGRGVVGSSVQRNTANVTGSSSTRTRASSHSPGLTPIFQGQTIRGQRKVYLPNIASGGGLAEMPPFSFGGLVRNQFSNPLRSGVYIPTDDINIGRIDWSLVEVDESGSGQGPIFKLMVEGVAEYTSTRCIAEDGGADVTISIATGDRVWVQVDDDGRGSAVGLTVMARLA